VNYRYPRAMRSRPRLLAVACSLVVLGAAACSGSDNQPVAQAPAAGSASVALVGPDEFERRVAEPGVVTINVHVPDEGDIAGTDLSIPYDRIADDPQLPADKGTPLAVYCRSDSMSATAVADLRAAGYTDVVELDGGFNAWKASGRPLE